MNEYPYRPAPVVTEAENKALRERLVTAEKQLREALDAHAAVLAENVALARRAGRVLVMSERFEHKVLSTKDHNIEQMQELLSALEKDGWEFVQHVVTERGDQTVKNRIYLKRRVAK